MLCLSHRFTACPHPEALDGWQDAERVSLSAWHHLVGQNRAISCWDQIMTLILGFHYWSPWQPHPLSHAEYSRLFQLCTDIKAYWYNIREH